jgi:type VI secretion system protein ImpH
MAGTKREHGARLRALLLAEPRSFEFVQAIRLLEQTAPLGTVPIGHAGPLDREQVRFVHDPSMAFAASDISGLRETPEGRTEVLATFFGLLGAASPLPVYFTEDVLDADSSDDPTLRAFYDILHQRLYALFYRAKQKYRFATSGRADMRDAFSKRMMAFVGVDYTAVPGKGLDAARMLGLAPLLAPRTRSARALAIYLEASFEGVPVEIEPFIGRTVLLEDSQRNALGKRNAALGASFTLGGRVEDRSGRFRTKLGPVDRDMFDALLPGGAQHDFLREVMNRFAGGQLEAEVDVLLRGGGPRFRLGDPSASKLGATTTLGGTEEKPTRARFVLDDDPSKVRTQLLTDDPSS